MASAALHGFFDIQPASAVTSPPAAHRKDISQARHAPSEFELDNLTFGKCYNGPVESGAQTPKTPNELEMSRPPSPVGNDAVPIMQSWNNPPMNKWRILCCCLIYLGNGINDSVIGALIPYMEVYYRIGYAVMSMVFVGNAAGFIVAAFFTNTTLGRLGRAKTLMLAEVIMMSAYIMLVATPPYPVVVIAFFILGYGAATNLALNNVFCANLHPPNAILGAAHGSYGVGGIIAPIIGTAMVSHGILWSRFYFISLGLRLCCIVFAAWSFWSYKEDASQTLLTAVERTASRPAQADERNSSLKELKLALRNRATIFGALFIFAYQGAEVSISGWVISFLINYRDGDPARVGYVTAGFWGGITIGRFVLTHLAPKVGEKNFVTILTLGTLGLQLMAWLIPNIIGNAIAVAALGLLLGPVYPCAQTVFSRLMPRHVQTTAIGFIGGAGSSGGAVAPFTTGLLAQAAGTWVLHPICIGLYMVMLACWFSLPKTKKRTV
ncbi:MFS general substrate transporter [Trematosphaeria pertusa]|uniref:MFS general substrate transporter n=1 Tax=Trematosphaeria pertusa TaxID=390896 RepID=A0A6A6HSB1_9PLEO|nr:MFS general substrate transporter [Trematosphaeria pertusa]KAF2241064.1 MFS general substrate transporter [Trematosphaeria pertusa]